MLRALRGPLESQLEIQRPHPRLRARRNSLNRVALGAQPRDAERALGSAREARAANPVVDGRLVNVEHPALAAIGGPFDDEVLDGLVDVVRDDVDVAGVACTAHGDVREFSAAAVDEDVGAVDGRPLHAVDGDGGGVVESVVSELLADETLVATVVEPDGQLLRANCSDGAAFAGDESTVA